MIKRHRQQCYRILQIRELTTWITLKGKIGYEDIKTLKLTHRLKLKYANLSSLAFKTSQALAPFTLLGFAPAKCTLNTLIPVGQPFLLLMFYPSQHPFPQPQLLKKNPSVLHSTSFLEGTPTIFSSLQRSLLLETVSLHDGPQ